MKSVDATEEAVETHALPLGWILELDVWPSLGSRNSI